MGLDVEKQLSARKITSYDFDPDATTLTDIGWVDMKGYEGLLVSFFRTVGVSDLVLKILANSASDGSGDEVVIATKTFTAGQPNAVGDYVFLECLASQIAQAGSDNGYDLRYASAQVSVATLTDEGVVNYVQDNPRFKHSALTADSIA